MYQLTMGITLHIKRCSYGTAVENNSGTLNPHSLPDLETLIPLEEYRSDHDGNSSCSNREEKSLVLCTMHRARWSYWWRRPNFSLWNGSRTEILSISLANDDWWGIHILTSQNTNIHNPSQKMASQRAYTQWCYSSITMTCSETNQILSRFRFILFR